MINTVKALKPLGLLALAAVGLGLVGCQTSSDRSFAEQWGDRQVAGEVKKELSKDPQYKYPNVVPVVYEGTVQLTGYVHTPEQRQKAAELASQAKGVRQVVNAIALKPIPTTVEQFSTNEVAPATISGPAKAMPISSPKGQELLPKR